MDEDYPLRCAWDTGNHYSEGINLTRNDAYPVGTIFVKFARLWFLSSILKCLSAKLLSKPVCMDTENSRPAGSLPCFRALTLVKTLH